MILSLLLAAAIPVVFWPNDPATADAIRDAGIKRTKLSAPITKMRMNVAAATNIPWVDANGWRFLRGATQVVYPELPSGSAALAAAEAHAYGVDAVLAPNADDVPAVEKMLAFLKSVDGPRLPAMANIGVVDDGSPLLGEVLNLLGRRNLLYHVVRSDDPKMDLIVHVGSREFPKEAAANPSDFAARVREKLTDDKRLLRIYGTYTVLGHLTGEGLVARLYLLNYSKSPARDVHVRVLGSYKRARLADSHDAAMSAADLALHQGGTEFTIPVIHTYTIVDLER